MKIKDVYGIEHEAILISSEDSPYLDYEYTVVKKIRKYNPNFGDDRICICGHPYIRHFDVNKNMWSVGCKKCSCIEFKENIK